MTAAEPVYDLCVIGGGINGAGIARDAAGRGLSVILLEKGDLGGATSSASTKLIHGGLRYLEYGDFGLVRHSLQEREILLRLAPHIIWPLTFILPHEPHLRPAWMIRAGLFLYDHLGGRKTLPGSKAVRLASTVLEPHLVRGFSYADCWVEDSRLVILNAIDAAEHGAVIRPRAACTRIIPAQDGWYVETQESGTIAARAIINAAGPWVRQVVEHSGLAEGTPGIRLVKGSHIVVPHLHEGGEAYILQQPDRRIVFVIPYEGRFSLIGTTERDFTGDPATPRIDDGEIAYLCDAVNRTFRKKIAPQDVIWSYSGVRPLFDDGGDNATAVTRDYRLVLDNSHGAPLLSVFGGKITTYRQLAQEAVNLLTAKPAWTAAAPLPGGDFTDFEAFCAEKIRQYPHPPAPLIRRYARAYGTRMDMFVTADMGRDFGDGVYEAEIAYLMRHEWAQTADDILWRRSKLGLHVSPEAIRAISNFVEQKS